jgi:hypothetical protein
MKDMQLDLFNIKGLPTSVALQKAACNGRLFYSIRQASHLLGISGFRVYYLVYYYRLDALLIGGEYRIPYTAILDYLTDQAPITCQYFNYLAWTEAREVKGFFSFLQDNTSLPVLPEGMPVTLALAERMLQRVLPDPMANDSTSCDPTDWYALSDLGMPLKGSVDDWAHILQSTPTALLADGEWNEESIIDYPEMLDWLVEREIVNLPIPYRFITPKNGPELEESGQLELF